MPQSLATLGCYAFIAWLFWRDRDKNAGVSAASWVPFCWMFFAGSRYLSGWLSSLGIYGSRAASRADVYMEGSPIDMPVFVLLIIASFVILAIRRANWLSVFSQNPLLAFFYLFAFSSILWSDYPLISLKRLLKSVGCVSMLLVLLTEQRPYAAVGAMFKRLAFLLLPLSVLFIKYYPHLGREYHSTGVQMFRGVTTQKNSLGELCLLVGLYFVWSVLYVREDKPDLGKRLEALTYALILAMMAWLLVTCDSKTALVCLLVATTLLLAGRVGFIARKRQRLMTLSALYIALYAILQSFFDLNAVVYQSLNRRADLTTRVPMWEHLVSMAQNHWIGFGWESFWLGDRFEAAFASWQVTSTHNAYLDVYLNLGVIGVLGLIGVIAMGLRQVYRLFATDSEYAVLRLTAIVVVALYGWTETVSFGVSNMYVLLLLGILEVPQPPADTSMMRDRKKGPGNTPFRDVNRTAVGHARVLLAGVRTAHGMDPARH